MKQLKYGEANHTVCHPFQLKRQQSIFRCSAWFLRSWKKKNTHTGRGETVHEKPWTWLKNKYKWYIRSCFPLSSIKIRSTIWNYYTAVNWLDIKWSWLISLYFLFIQLLKVIFTECYAFIKLCTFQAIFTIDFCEYFLHVYKTELVSVNLCLM